MYKIVAMLKRKPELTHEQFKDYYETTHAKIGVPYLKPHCVKYIRRYLQAAASPMKPGPVKDAEYDCISELWFADEAAYKAFEASVADPEIVALLVADEQKFLDRANSRRFLVDEHLSWGPES
jgi:hypothetical protein